MRKWMLPIVLLSLLFLLASCSLRGMQGAPFTAENIPDEPPKDEITAAIKQSANNEIDDIIEANFPEVYTVEGDNSNAEIFATTQFGLTELSSVLSGAIEPEEISDVKDNQQILIYPDDFITLRESEEDQDVLLIEVASDEFVRRNYSPNFLSTFFAISLLGNMLDTDDWGSRRQGDYKGMGSLNVPRRGITTFRGGGPGAGK
ncbi:DUF4247 domain-containing protein [Virgibacillus ihumii]|uniref:DUF4247 domain-containing protein n=1 Tax=Virgibacillus ihumii TaxID=2686091 RepID=UPI001FEC4950|nr:DUF4247 domain-containing protein [Virgibacillus ihumii]